MPISACEKNRIIRRDLVEVLSRWKLGWFPKRFDPPPARDPFALFGLRNSLFNFRQKILKRVCPFEIQPHLALANSENVAMRIG